MEFLSSVIVEEVFSWVEEDDDVGAVGIRAEELEVEEETEVEEDKEGKCEEEDGEEVNEGDDADDGEEAEKDDVDEVEGEEVEESSLRLNAASAVSGQY